MDTRTDTPAGAHADELKACCAAVYASDWARLLLGESFHPGGLALTERLGTLLDLESISRLPMGSLMLSSASVPSAPFRTNVLRPENSPVCCGLVVASA